jgi:D-beta-D-heptose 7-phosphate kinase/D-beta-D-heptose 1-phosphate adenosyltransferase
MVKVWTNGCFDILHRGHIELFKHAKSLGEYLKVGVDSDWKVRKTKGMCRPINKQTDRVALLTAIRYVDEVVIFETPGELAARIKDYSPDILVVGSDWEGREVVGAEYAREVKYFKRLEGYSTTSILEKLK